MKLNQDVSIPRGNTRILRLPITRAGDPYSVDPIGPADFRLFYTIKDGANVVLTRDTNEVDSGITLMEGSTTTVDITLSSSDTDRDPKEYTHELEVWHPDGSRWDAMHGKITITASVVHPTAVS